MAEKRAAQGEQLTELVGLCGEFPADAVYRLGGGREYKQDLITRLKKTGVIKVHYRDKLRGYRLTPRSKRLFLTTNPDRFEFYLTGNCDTSVVQSDVTRRLRLHRIANVIVTMYNADIKIFRDEKPDVFNPDNDDDIEITEPAFYSSREFKELNHDMVKVQNARAVGILLSCKDIFIVYNTENAMMKWDYNAEVKVKSIIWQYLCHTRMPNQYFYLPVTGLLFGNSMEMMYQVMTNKDKRGKNYFLFDGTFDRFIFLTNDRHGEVLLKLLCDREKRYKLDSILRQKLKPHNPSSLTENDAIDENGNPVLFAYLPDMPRLARFVGGLKLRNGTGTIICFDFQQEVLSKYCGELVDVRVIDFEEFMAMFYPKTEPTANHT